MTTKSGQCPTARVLADRDVERGIGGRTRGLRPTGTRGVRWEKNARVAAASISESDDVEDRDERGRVG
jgi:hypothetical protein